MALASTSFAAFAQVQDTAVRAAMDAVIRAELARAGTLLQGFFVLYICITFIHFSRGDVGISATASRIVRATLVYFFIHNSAIYVTNVRDLFFDSIPNEIASVINGYGARITAGQQFDIVATNASNMVATARAANTGWTTAALSNDIAAWMASWGMQITMAVQGGVWLLGRKLMAIVLCFGPWVLLFELFDRTRGWVDQWIGKLVGLTCFQLASSILLQFQLRGEQSLMIQFQNSPTQGADELIAQLYSVMWFMFTDALTMLALPMICAIGSGIAASHGVGQAILLAAPGRVAAGMQAVDSAASRSGGLPGVARGARNLIGR